MNHTSNKDVEWSEENQRKREAHKKGRSQITRDGKKETGNSGSGKNLTLSSQMQSTLCTYCGMYQDYINFFIGLYKQSNQGGNDEANTSKWSQTIYYLICFSLFLLLCMDQKLPGFKKYTFKQGSLTYQKEVSVQAGEILLDIYYQKLWLTLQRALKFSLIFSLPIQYLTRLFHFYCFLYIYKKMSREGDEKGIESN